MHPAKRAPASSAPPRRLSLDRFLPYRLAVLAREISVALARKYQADLGISIPEWRVIAHIAEVGTCSSGELCARTAMDKAKVNRAVTRLVAAGLVLAEISDRDRRLNVLKLTARGCRVYERVVPMALDHERALLDALSEAERRELMRIIGKLQEHVKKLWGLR
jgi:DNA-binding MarR family transcriptional regulator